ncbi:MAG TPA: hypothetical protein VEL28_07060 [Candidatus Binatia bacterium]|nr:hypothetical protein [Candidatus Binatia bacterium]
MTYSIRPSAGGRTLSRLATFSSIAACLLLAGCPQFPSPGAATPPLTQEQADALTRCQSSIAKAQNKFSRTKTKELQKCVLAVLAVKIPFDNGVTSSGEYAAAIAEITPKCAKGYAKITKASTKFVDAVVKACEPVEDLIGPDYDGLRFEAGIGSTSEGIEDLAGDLCTLTEMSVDGAVWYVIPRTLELLDELGPDFVAETENDGSEGYPNVELDPRCPAISTFVGGATTTTIP